jgi:2,3-bisphosphoglycerate-independent phosphoglycerate mutase
MKYIIILGDGMADEPIGRLGNKTPLQAADTPCMDELALRGRSGLLDTIPEGMTREARSPTSQYWATMFPASTRAGACWRRPPWGCHPP